MEAEELNRIIGKNVGVRLFEVEKGAIRRFADAVADPNPLFRDEEYARQSRYGGIIASPGFFGWPLKQTMGAPLVIEFPADLMEPLAKSGYMLASALDGGIEYDFFLPVRAGDTLTATGSIKDIRERAGRAGKMCFIILETVYYNQNGALVARARATTILRSFSL
ncbi:MAG: MaoC family dehydratase N-terminal domain-containing protein [Dehalococcoidia bacterium]|nr:MaoC family dehydratase N-terminal domain-containing protein [Dehalococcoidia bacterium]